MAVFCLILHTGSTKLSDNGFHGLLRVGPLRFWLSKLYRQNLNLWDTALSQLAHEVMQDFHMTRLCSVGEAGGSAVFVL